MSGYRTVYEDVVRGCIWHLRCFLRGTPGLPKGSAPGWYLVSDAGEFLPEFHFGAGEPYEIVRIRAREHCRHLGLREFRLPVEEQT